ncbi:MAG: CPBP family intramembrane metalloprotease [Acidobacteria bacterium]|nr:CPBP family intramembrane metalloprotease [Acidobacteriota bacterium]
MPATVQHSCAFRLVAEALAFSLAVVSYIWVLRAVFPSSIWVYVLAALASMKQREETVSSAGLGFRALTSALAGWKLWWLLSITATGALAWGQSFSIELLYRGLLYFLWCVLQQLVYQNMVYKRLREAFGPGWKAWIISGILFSSVHLPNPVLVPSTLAWGMLASRLFERQPSVPALGLLQFLLSTVLLWLTPLRWHRNFRVGPGYFHASL